MTKQVSRRDFLLWVTATAGGLVVSCSPTRSPSADAVPTLVDASQLPTAAPTAAATPGQFAAPDPNQSGLIVDETIILTPINEFYVMTYSSTTPEPNIDEWTLTIDGLVDNPLALSFNDIRNLQRVTDIRTLECISNPAGGNLVGNARWTGTPLLPLLEAVGIQGDAIRAKFTAADDYSTAVDLEWILQPDTLLVYEMNDQPLAADHGYPVRIMMPGLYGQKMPKWLTRIEFVDEVYLGYWEEGGWDDRAEVKTTSQIALPKNLSVIEGSVFIQGWAYAGRRRIEMVELRIDNGEWRPCELSYGPSDLCWTQWWLEWTPIRTGSVPLAVRATDETNFTQTVETSSIGELDDPFPNGSDRIHAIALVVSEAPDGS
ncbi:MAG: molybdopterin-dependent oxidoreductase [Chloroflexi bacterium]|nr:molybdopterin-dependent oxidoreductase [Chloroflexota bacterium]